MTRIVPQVLKKNHCCQGGSYVGVWNVAGNPAGVVPVTKENSTDQADFIRDLMWFSDLENLLSIGRIFYQLGESYLNLFLLHKVENL